MNLLEIKDFLSKLPEEFDTFELVNGEYGILGDEGIQYRADKPIQSITVDEETKEILFLHQSNEEIKEIIED